MTGNPEDQLRSRLEDSDLDIRITSVEFNSTRGFTVQHVDEELRSGEIVNALLHISTLMEIVFSRLLQRRFEISEDQFDELWNRSSLGRYWQLCRVTEAHPSPAPNEEIERIIGFRNKLVHEAGYLEELQSDEDEISEIESSIRTVMRYIDSIEFSAEWPDQSGTA
jgi:hypothetical protein